MKADQSQRFANLDWPDGWFVFEQGVVRGPFTTQETFSTKVRDPDAGTYMVSRKGFGRWYSLNELAGVYHQADRIGVATGATVREIESVLSQEMGRLSKLHRTVSEQRKAALGDLDQTGQRARGSVLAPRQQDAKGATGPIRPNSELSKKASAPAGLHRGTLDSRRPRTGGTGTPRNMESKRGEAPSGTRISQKVLADDRAIAYHHLILAGRLRLGNLCNPWLEAYAKFFAALGFYWPVWFRRAVMDVTFHIDGSLVPKSTRLFWQAMVPGLHLVLTRKLAVAMANMERQNGYQTVSPAKAMWLAVFPPLAIHYLQKALNRHWSLHVKHAAFTAAE